MLTQLLRDRVGMNTQTVWPQSLALHPMCTVTSLAPNSGSGHEDAQQVCVFWNNTEGAWLPVQFSIPTFPTHNPESLPDCKVSEVLGHSPYRG